jgi:Arc/MetJ family transcription regulator
MSRTNIDLPDDLVAEVMVRFDLPTKRSAVEFALRRLLGSPLTPNDIDSMCGVGWEGDLEAMRADDPVSAS